MIFVVLNGVFVLHFACFFVVLRASGIKLKFTVMVPEDDHNNTVWVGGSMLASTGALDGAYFWHERMWG